MRKFILHGKLTTHGHLNEHPANKKEKIMKYSLHNDGSENMVGKMIACKAGTEDVLVSYRHPSKSLAVWIDKKYHSVDKEDLQQFVEQLG